MIALDTNILVYAHRYENKFYAAAREHVERLAEGRDAWAVPWSCVHEFYGVVTNRRIFAMPTPKEAALAQIDAWLASPTLVLLHEGTGHWNLLREFIDVGQITGPWFTTRALQRCALPTACANSGRPTATSTASRNSRCATR